jgi:hypothetical protein
MVTIPTGQKLKVGDVVNYHGVAAAVFKVGPTWTEVLRWDGAEMDVPELEEYEAFIHMVGDDRTIRIVMDDFEVIDDDEYCGGCGQIGCAHG